MQAGAGQSAPDLAGRRAPMGLPLGDTALPREEIDGLSAGLLVSKSGEPPAHKTRMSDWLDEIGARYESEPDRHYG